MLNTEGQGDFLLTLMPGVSLTLGRFTMGISSENLLDFNFSNSARATSFDDKIYLGHASYRHYIKSSSYNTSISTTAYFKSVPDVEMQYGGSLLLDIKNSWMQAGYNSFYGPSVGLGAKIFKIFNVGGLVELGNANDNFNLGPTFEFLLGLSLDKTEDRTAFAGPVKRKHKKKENKAIEIEQIKTLEVIPEKDSIAAIPLVNFFKPVDSKDHFSVIEGLEGVDYGFYLIVNVYATEKYFKLFMDTLKKANLSPKYFFNKNNGYYYVYLDKYDDLSAIRKAREANYNGTYKDETWILWVKEKDE